MCDVNIRDLLEFHRKNGKIATLTAVQVDQRFGVLELLDNTVRAFREKAHRDNEYVNAGYMVLEPEIFRYLEDDSTVFEREPLERLVADQQLASYRHRGYWQCMDTKKEQEQLELLWQSGEAPWHVWND